MLHPSYVELMNAVNEKAREAGEVEGDESVVTSRYSIVIAAAKRARQIIERGEDEDEEGAEMKKPLSIAIEELANGKVHILPEGEEEDDDDFYEDYYMDDTVDSLDVENEEEYYEEDEEPAEYDEDAYEEDYEDDIIDEDLETPIDDEMEPEDEE